jgi:cell division protease FtsH
MSSNVKTAVFWVVIICAVVLVYMAMKTSRGSSPKNMTVSELIQYVQDGKVKDATVSGTDVQGTLADNTQFHTTVPPTYTKLFDLFESKGVKWAAKEPSGNGWIGVMVQFVPILVIL